MRAPAIPFDSPFREVSHHVACKPHLWHVQDVGSGPTPLLIHGAGGATHSFRHLIPLLATDRRIIAVDLPGQGFTVMGGRQRCGLDQMAEYPASLIRHEGWRPLANIGHLAGAALALRPAELVPVGAVIGINGALGELAGIADWAFPILARTLALTPFAPALFSKLAGTPAQVHQLITSTGSRLGAGEAALYRRLLQRPGHVAATLSMRAQWNLGGLLRRLGVQRTPSLLITASHDRAVPSVVSQRAAQTMPDAQWIDSPGLGHHVHEEAADQVAVLIRDFLERRKVEGAV